jgi:hypothetical protein
MIACGGRSSHDTSPAKDAGSKPAFVDVACGAQNACALRDNGEIQCWGYSLGQAAPNGPMVTVTTSGDYACGLREDGTTACWGSLIPMLPAGQYVSVTASLAGPLCALSADGAAACPLFNPVSGPTDVPLPGTFKSVEPVDNPAACGIATTGEVLCDSPADPSWQDPPPSSVFEQLACGSNFCCGISSLGNTECWGDVPEISGEQDPPAGTFSAIQAADAYACAQRPDGTLVCWGGWSTGKPNDLPTGSFGRFCVGVDFGCGIRADGTLNCWGLSTAGVGSPPNP